MKQHILSRTLSLTAAAVMSWSVVSSTGVLQIAAAQTPPVQPRTQAAGSACEQTDSDEPVTVIVKVSGDAVMAQPEAVEMGTDFLDTDAAAQLTEQYKALQRSVQNSIRQFYPELQVGFSYSTLFNGFSCKLPTGLMDRVRELPDVVSVTVSQDIDVPQMSRAAALSGFPAYYDLTGCSGEGQVIAVIDSELDYTHPMFAPLADGIETAVSKEEVAEVINSGTLNVAADAERAYISNKLPFVMNYADPEHPYDCIANPDCYHGTHVSGIAAGNEFEAADGTTISGIAKDAQLMFFGVSSGPRTVSGDAGLAAIEDAVRLHADVINMSWGADGREYWGENPFSEAIIAADRAGVIVCNAAGNADNGLYSWGEITVPENPDTGMMGDKAELGSPIMMVASADNTGLADAGAFVFNGELISLMPMMDTMSRIYILSNGLRPGDYEYADCGNGAVYEFEEAGDISGKIALVQSSGIPAQSIAENAEAHGACGVLLISPEIPSSADYILSDSQLTINGISWLDGQKMLEAEDKVLTITGVEYKREYATVVSSYTAWGVKDSLDLRPDIMGIGARVQSAGYYGSTETMSGTSMASPYVAGCTAVLREYLKKQNTELTGSDFAAYVRRLMMNAATPYEEDGVFVTPRRQGAGLVSLDKALAAKVLMTGPAGDAKVNLFDKLGDSFSFEVTLTNYSSEDVTYPQAEIRLTTDGTFYDSDLKTYRTAGQQQLNCTTDFSGPVTIAAGESRTVTVSVSLDAAQCRQLEELFLYGFFAEGYLMLSGAENSTDISIPMLGFHGDWTQIPIMNPEEDSLLIRLGIQEDVYPVSIVRKGVLLKQILSRIPENKLKKQNYALEDYATKEELLELKCGSGTCWISPNNDSIADQITAASYYNYRRWQSNHKSSAEMIDSDGAILYSDDYPSLARIHYDELDDGDYFIDVKRWIDYPGAAEHPQIHRTNVIIDRVAPEVQYEYTSENGRNYLVIRASDNRQLQGLTVSGIGTGGEAGVYQPGGEKQIIEKINFAEILYPESYDGTDILRIMGYSNVDTLPYALRSIGGCAGRDAGKDFNFADAVAAEPDFEGVWTVKYDITDLEFYSVTVMDEAYNFVEIRSESKAAEQLAAKQGMWMDLNEGFFAISGNTITHRSFQDGSVTQYRYTADKGKLTLVSGNQTKEYSVWYLSETCFQMIDLSDDSVWTLVQNEQTENLSDVNEVKDFIPLQKLMEEILKYGREKWNLEPEIKYCYAFDWAEFEIELDYTDESGFLIQENYSINRYSGRGYYSYFKQLDENYELGMEHGSSRIWFCQEIMTEIPAGLYAVDSYFMMQFNDDGETGMFRFISPSVGFFPNAIIPLEETPFTYSFDEDGKLELRYTNNGTELSLRCDVTRAMEFDGIILYINCDMNTTDEWNLRSCAFDQEQIAKLRSTEEYCRLAAAYINAIACTDLAPRQTKQIGYNSDTNTFYYALVFDGVAYNIEVDPFTLDVTDEEGNKGNLLNPPKMPENAAYTMSEIKVLASRTYQEKTGIRPVRSMAVLTGDGQVEVILYDEYSNYLEIYYVDPVTGSIETKLKHRGDVNCDGDVDVADVVLLSRVLAEDREVTITAEGRHNADCNLDQVIDFTDVHQLLRAIARCIRFG